MQVSTLLVATVRALTWEEHADEAVESFLAVEIFHCVSFLSIPPDSATGSSRHITPREVEALSLRQ